MQHDSERTATQLDQSLLAHGYSFPPIDNLHHDMLLLPNGHWIALANVTESLTGLQCSQGAVSVQGDILMDIDPSGNVVWAWSAFDHEDPCRALFGLPDWTHSNALVYTADGNLLLSQRNQSWIIKDRLRERHRHREYHLALGRRRRLHAIERRLKSVVLCAALPKHFERHRFPDHLGHLR